MALSGDFDISLELDVLHMEPCRPQDESVVLLQTEFNDKRKVNSEVKFSIHNGGDRKAETQQRRIRGDGTFNYQEIVSRPQVHRQPAETGSPRRCDLSDFPGEPDSPPEILGAMKMGTDPVPSGLLRHPYSHRRRQSQDNHPLQVTDYSGGEDRGRLDGLQPECGVLLHLSGNIKPVAEFVRIPHRVRILTNPATCSDGAIRSDVEEAGLRGTAICGRQFISVPEWDTGPIHYVQDCRLITRSVMATF